MPVACAMEMLHTYSLIHDDLPCMDNDDLRRGRPPTTRSTASARPPWPGTRCRPRPSERSCAALPAERRAACAEIWPTPSGWTVCAADSIWICWEGRDLTEQELTEINSRKTGALLIAACLMGVAAAGGTDAQEEAAARYGAALGMAFQIRDDMLDVLSTEQELGKPIGSDAQEQKNTYMALYGEGGARKWSKS